MTFGDESECIQISIVSSSFESQKEKTDHVVEAFLGV